MYYYFYNDKEDYLELRVRTKITKEEKENIKKVCANRDGCGFDLDEKEPCPYSYYDEEECCYMCEFFTSDGALPCDW